VPWIPELFSAPVLARIWDDERRRALGLVPFFAGLMTGETSALVDSFAGEPELHHPVRGRIKGAPAFTRFVDETRTWLAERAAGVDEDEFVIVGRRGVEEVVLHLGDVALPVAIASDKDERGRILEQRVYFSDGAHSIRPPVLQPTAGATMRGAVGDYHRALAAGDLEGVLAALAPDGSVREPAGRVHRGTDALREFHARRLRIELEHCAVVDDGRACALEYNLVAGGRPQAGLAVHVRGDSGAVDAVRIYDDVGL